MRRNGQRAFGRSKQITNGSMTTQQQGRLPTIANMQDESFNESCNIAGFQFGLCTQQGKRPYQEDEYAARPFLGSQPGSLNVLQETHLFGIFDGHAGGKCSKQISQTLPDILAEDGFFLNNLPQALKRSMHTANDIFLKVAERQRLHDGSTGIVALIRDGKLLVGNVGDCRALLISAGRPIQMSTDQKPTSPDEQKRIIGLGGAVLYCMGVARVNGVLAVSRAFGNRTLRTVIRPDAEMMQRELTKDDDYLVIASDGMWDVLRNKDVSEICYALQGQSSQFIAEELVQTALMRGSMDNVTCLVVNINGYINRVKGAKLSSSSNNNNGILLSSTLNGNGIRPSSSQQATSSLFNNNAMRHQASVGIDDNIGDFNNDMNNSIISRSNDSNNNNSRTIMRSQLMRNNLQRPVTVQSQQQTSYLNSNIDDDNLTYVSESQNIETPIQPQVSRQSASSRLAAAFGFQQQQQKQQQQQHIQRNNQQQVPLQLQVGLFGNSGASISIPSSPIQTSWKQMRPSTTGTGTGRSLMNRGAGQQQYDPEIGIGNRPSPIAMLLERTTGSNSILNSSNNVVNNSNSINGSSLLRRLVQRGGGGGDK